MYQLLSICLVLGTNVFNLLIYFLKTLMIWMILYNQYAVALSVNNTTHLEIKLNLLFVIFYLRCKSETGLDNYG